MGRSGRVQSSRGRSVFYEEPESLFVSGRSVSTIGRSVFSIGDEGAGVEGAEMSKPHSDDVA